MNMTLVFIRPFKDLNNLNGWLNDIDTSLLRMEVCDLNDDAARAFAARVKEWKPYIFFRRLTKRHIQQLVAMGFTWPGGIETLDSMKSLFTDWVQQHPQFQSLNPDETIYLMRMKGRIH